MDLQKIISGKGNVQFLHRGYRLHFSLTQYVNRHYFFCVRDDCKARMGIQGELDGDYELIFHRLDAHNHDPDVAANLVAATLSDLRASVRADPNVPLQRLYKEICAKTLTLAEESIKQELETKLPSYN